MTNRKYNAALALALILSGCGQTQTPQNDEQAATGRLTEAGPKPGGDAISSQDAASAEGATAANDGQPDLTPPRLTPEAERGEKGARNLLLSFARAIELREFDQARAMLGPADREKWSKTGFAALFADLGKITVSMPDGTMEGAAGSLYYAAPVTITAKDSEGRPVRIEGTAVLRRVNDVDGATPAQLRWHFETLTLDWTH